MHEPRIVVALVEILKDSGEDLWLLLGQADTLVVGLEELVAAAGREERGEAQDLFVGGEKSLFRSDTEGDDGGGQVAVDESSSAPTYLQMESW